MVTYTFLFSVPSLPLKPEPKSRDRSVHWSETLSVIFKVWNLKTWFIIDMFSIHQLRFLLVVWSFFQNDLSLQMLNTFADQ